MSDSITDDLARSTEDVVPSPAPPTVVPDAVVTADDTATTTKGGKLTIKDIAAENDKLAAENATLRLYIDDELEKIKKQVAAMAMQTGFSEVKTAKSSDMLDEDQPFAKTRTSSGGIFYEQNGVFYDGAGKKRADQSGNIE